MARILREETKDVQGAEVVVLERSEHFKIFVPRARVKTRLEAEREAREHVSRVHGARFCEVRLMVEVPEGFQVALVRVLERVPEAPVAPEARRVRR